MQDFERGISRDRIVFVLQTDDVQGIAQERIGRELTVDEMYIAKKCIEWGLESWSEIVEIAVDEAVDNNTLKHDQK